MFRKSSRNGEIFLREALELNSLQDSLRLLITVCRTSCLAATKCLSSLSDTSRGRKLHSGFKADENKVDLRPVICVGTDKDQLPNTDGGQYYLPNTPVKCVTSASVSVFLSAEVSLPSTNCNIRTFWVKLC